MNTNAAGAEGTIHLIKCGRIVTVTGVIKPTITGTVLNLCFMPSGKENFKPSFTQIWLSCDYYTTAGTNQAEAYMTTDGVLVMSTPVKNVEMKISGAYVVNT